MIRLDTVLIFPTARTFFFIKVQYWQLCDYVAIFVPWIITGLIDRFTVDGLFNPTPIFAYCLGMRTSRDTKMAELNAIKNQLKEQNQRLLQVEYGDCIFMIICRQTLPCSVCWFSAVKKPVPYVGC